MQDGDGLVCTELLVWSAAGSDIRTHFTASVEGHFGGGVEGGAVTGTVGFDGGSLWRVEVTGKR
ncbi:hypothetical protein BH10BDE1_BH10BDE1_27260 [soil metagenome]